MKEPENEGQSGMPHGEPRIAELSQAFLWTCEDCGRDNFERAITVSPQSADLSRVPDPDMAREWAMTGGHVLVMAPDRVSCRYCAASFGTSEV